jgi:hypothetical protein
VLDPVKGNPQVLHETEMERTMSSATLKGIDCEKEEKTDDFPLGSKPENRKEVKHQKKRDIRRKVRQDLQRPSLKLRGGSRSSGAYFVQQDIEESPI